MMAWLLKTDRWGAPGPVAVFVELRVPRPSAVLEVLIGFLVIRSDEGGRDDGDDRSIDDRCGDGPF